MARLIHEPGLNAVVDDEGFVRIAKPVDSEQAIRVLANMHSWASVWEAVVNGAASVVVVQPDGVTFETDVAVIVEAIAE